MGILIRRFVSVAFAAESAASFPTILTWLGTQLLVVNVQNAASPSHGTKRKVICAVYVRKEHKKRLQTI